MRGFCSVRDIESLWVASVHFLRVLGTIFFALWEAGDDPEAVKT